MKKFSFMLAVATVGILSVSQSHAANYEVIKGAQAPPQTCSAIVAGSFD